MSRKNKDADNTDHGEEGIPEHEYLQDRQSHDERRRIRYDYRTLINTMQRNDHVITLF